MLFFCVFISDGKILDEITVEKIIDDIHEAIEDIKNKINEDDLDKSLGK